MKRLCCFVALIICILFPAAVFADISPKLVGTWGFAQVKYYYDTTWYTETGTIIFNSNGTGTLNVKKNDGGTLKTQTRNITSYSTVANNDGSISVTLTIEGQGALIKRFVLSDDGKMFLEDSTVDITGLSMLIAVKLDTARTYANSDFNGSYYSISYEHDSSGGFFNPAHFIAYSHIDTFDGVGGMLSDHSWNADSSLGSVTGIPNTYWLNPDRTIQTSSNYVGYGSGDLKIGVGAAPTVNTTWQIHGTIKKGDRTYSTADLAGTWVSVAFGDEDATTFHSAVGLWTCNSGGNCAVSHKFQKNGVFSYGIDGLALTVSPDGTFGGSLSASSPAYAAAIGNNGNTAMMNWSLDTGDPGYRHVKMLVKCNGCVNITGRMIPMLAINPGDGMNIYIYDPATQIINTVKENSNMSWLPILNSDQSRAVYSDGPQSDDPQAIWVYNTLSKSNSQIGGKFTSWESAYFDRNGKILFIDSTDGAIKRMDSNGTNVVTVTTPQPPYTFRVFWLSPDRQTIAAIEERTPGDYYSTNHDRVVFINAETGTRISTLAEYHGEWNMGSWRPDSSRFLYYYHAFDGGSTAKYAAYSNLSAASPTVTDLSGSSLGQKEENVLFYTKSGNLLSLSYRELYNGQTGAFIADRSADVPVMTNTMVGVDGNGEIYFANRDKSNFRRFVEYQSPLSCSNKPVVLRGTYPYYTMIQDAYSMAADGYTIDMQAGDFFENLDLQRNIKVKLSGGYGCSFSTVEGFSAIHGDLIVSSGTVTIENIVIQ